MRSIPNIFTAEELQLLRSLPQVISAYERLSKETSAYFTIPATQELKQKIADAFQIDLSSLSQLPCRWIKGDTPPHIDRAQRKFDDTYLVYLTDGDGEFHLGEDTYQIVAGTGYSFSEGVSHEVVGTNGSSRLLLGPMSEEGFAVGGATTIQANGQTETVSFVYESGSGIRYRINDGSLQDLSLPITIQNTNTAYRLKVLFETDITIESSIFYFICGSENIQFGSNSLESLGNKRTIIIDGVTGYPGLIRNGIISTPGESYISIYNLSVVTNNGSTLADQAGWIGQITFGNGASNNFIVNCSSSGDITPYGGGIVGEASGTGAGASLVIRHCSTYGSIGINAGGIVGNAAGSSGGSVTCEECWSEGAVNGQDGGGIFAGYAGNSGGYALALKCYSTGLIVNDAGGIFGGYAGDSTGEAYAQKCYSRGDIQGNGGGIFSRYAAFAGGITNANNCYSSGSVATTGYGIYGVNQGSGATLTNCYVANGSWSDSAANTVLAGVPSGTTPGTVWHSPGGAQPYELIAFGYTPYTINVINSSSELVQAYSQTIEVGEGSISALNEDASGNSFTILKITGGDSPSYGTISINSQTGVISTTSATVVGTYTIMIRSVGSYNITTFQLRVNPRTVTVNNNNTTACCVSSTDETGLSYEWINDYRIGNRLILEHSQNPNLKFNGYSEYIKYKMAQGSRKA